MRIDAKSPAGNVYAIMGAVQEVLNAANRGHEWPEVEKAMMSGDYNNACDVAEKVTYGTVKVINRD